jgi:sarcosine oxidase subunit beta
LRFYLSDTDKGLVAKMTAMPLPRNVDIVVVGGGIMGLFTALFLLEGGSTVAVLERGAFWAEASGTNAGSLGVQNKLPRLVPYALESMTIWRQLQGLIGSDIGYKNSGGLRVATSKTETEQLRSSAEEQSAKGVESVWLEGEELRRRVPWLSPSVASATFSPQDSYANPLALGPALIKAVSDRGGVLCPQTEVREIATNPRMRVYTTGGTVVCEKVIIAAGAWSRSVAQFIGVDLPLAYDVNMVSVTEPAGVMVPQLVTHVRGILTVKQVANGTCLIGGGWQGVGDLSSGRKEMSYESLLHNLRLAVEIIPSFKRLNLVRQWSGFEGVTPDSLPYFGALPGHPEVLITACARGGWTLGPLFGRLMAELVMSGATSMPIKMFSPGRFSNG